MTAEELLNEKVYTPWGKTDNNTVLELMIEFAKYHVELAKESILQKAEQHSDFVGMSFASYDGLIPKIENCYPIENIK
jgi:hypothetical protein